MVLGKLPLPGRPTYLDYSRARAYTAFAVGAVGDCLEIFSLAYHFSLLSRSLWETTQYTLKYCLKANSLCSFRIKTLLLKSMYLTFAL